MAATSLDEAKAKLILRQVEFYFSDSNLPRDNFLKKTVQESEDGLVSLALICSFARMRTHLGLGSLKPDDVPEEAIQAVAEVLRKSPALKVSEDGKRVGRSTELPNEEVMEQVDARTIAASPLPHDVKLEDVEAFFNQHGKVKCVRLPRHIHDKRHFCGTALVEFSEESDAQKLLKGKLVYAGAELEITMKKDFDDEREKRKEEFEKNCPSKSSSNESENYPKGLIISFKLKKKVAGEIGQDNMEEVTDVAENNEKVYPNSSANSANKKKTETSEDTGKEGKGKTLEDNLPEEEEDESDDKNTPLISDKNVITREDLKKVFQKFGIVKFIDYRMGEESGYIRFEDPEAAVKARAAAVLDDDGGLVVKNCVAAVEALTGGAEKDYWSKLQNTRAAQKGFRGRGRKQKGDKRSRSDANKHGKSQKVAASA